ncbi:MAG: hypothetical protein IKT58_04100 [Oscillospiraceae bacterium]|nr:hypothetical protein [Oscillospiraceae bacterium]
MVSYLPKKLFSLLLILSVILGLMPGKASATESSLRTTGLEGKTLSILGDSLSTYYGVSNNPSYNSTLAGSAIFYPNRDCNVALEGTWWSQAMKATGMELLVNNSWSGSCFLYPRYGADAAYKDRCVQLHDDTGEDAGRTPDIIVIEFGSNDYYAYPETLGSFEAINFNTLIKKTSKGYLYATPVTTLEAYAICLHKISQAYPKAEVYCFTPLPAFYSDTQPAGFCEDIARLSRHFGTCLVDLYHCGIGFSDESYFTHMGDNYHTNTAGMSAITGAFISALLENSRYISENIKLHDINFDLDQVVVKQGTSWTAVDGQSYRVDLVAPDCALLRAKVTMGGKDITAECYSEGKVYIPSVTGDVEITACPILLPKLSFAGASLTVASNIALNFKVSEAYMKAGGYSDVCVLYEMNGIQELVRYGDLKNGVYSFPFRNIRAQWMNDTLTATLYAAYEGEVVRIQTRKYSVATYCYNQLEKMEGPAYNAEVYSRMRTLLVDLLHYGTAMQNYVGYRTDSLVDAKLTDAQRSYGTQRDRIPENIRNMNYEVIPKPTAAILATGLELMDSVHMIFVTSLADCTGYRARIQCNDQEWWISGEDFLCQNGYYRVVFDGLQASQMSDTVLITLYKGNKAVSNTMAYSIESYVYARYNVGDPALQALVRMMLRYGDSAREFTRLSQ